MELRTLRYLPALVAYCEEQFPQTCSSCGRRFESFAEFLATTTPIGEPVLYDSFEDLLRAGVHPVGSLSYVNCGCRSTLTVKCGDTSSEQYLALMAAIREDVEATGMSASGVLDVLRREVRGRVMPGDTGTKGPGGYR